MQLAIANPKKEKFSYSIFYFFIFLGKWELLSIHGFVSPDDRDPIHGRFSFVPFLIYCNLIVSALHC